MLQGKALNQRIVAARTLKGWNQADLDRELAQRGWDKQDGGRIERGDKPLPPNLIGPLADVLDVTPEWFTDERLDLAARPAGTTDTDLARLESKLEDEFSLYRGFIGRVADIRTRDVQTITDKLDQVQRAVEANGDDLRATLRRVNERLADVEAGQARLAARARPRSSEDAGSSQRQGQPGRQR